MVSGLASMASGLAGGISSMGSSTGGGSGGVSWLAIYQDDLSRQTLEASLLQVFSSNIKFGS